MLKCKYEYIYVYVFLAVHSCHYDNLSRHTILSSLVLHIDHGFEVVCSSRVILSRPPPGGPPGDPLPGDGGGPPEKFIFRRPPPGQTGHTSDFRPGTPEAKNPVPAAPPGPPPGTPHPPTGNYLKAMLNALPRSLRPEDNYYGAVG